MPKRKEAKRPRRQSLSELMRATAMPPAKMAYPEATIAINNFAAARAYMYGTVYGEREASELVGRGRADFPQPRNDRYWKVW